MCYHEVQKKWIARTRYKYTIWVLLCIILKLFIDKTSSDSNSREEKSISSNFNSVIVSLRTSMKVCRMAAHGAEIGKQRFPKGI